MALGAWRLAPKPKPKLKADLESASSNNNNINISININNNDNDALFPTLARGQASLLLSLPYTLSLALSFFVSSAVDDDDLIADLSFA